VAKEECIDEAIAMAPWKKNVKREAVGVDGGDKERTR